MRRRTFLTAVPVLLLATACTGKDDKKPTSDVDAKQLVAKAAAAFADAKTAQLDLSSDGVPKDSNGVSAAKGSGVIDATTPKFQGQITGRISGVTGTIDIVAIGDETWVKLFTPNYQKLDLADLGAPNPAQFFHPTDGLPALLKATGDLKAGEQKREGADVLTEITGTLPAKAVYDLLRLGSGDGKYDVAYGITADGELRTIKVAGKLYGDNTSTYTVVVKNYGKPVDITEP